MKVGDELTLVPDLRPFGEGREMSSPRPCRVVYIHPRHRFFTVEFRSGMGETWRETRYFRRPSKRGGGGGSCDIA